MEGRPTSHRTWFQMHAFPPPTGTHGRGVIWWGEPGRHASPGTSAQVGRRLRARRVGNCGRGGPAGPGRRSAERRRCRVTRAGSAAESTRPMKRWSPGSRGASCSAPQQRSRRRRRRRRPCRRPRSRTARHGPAERTDGSSSSARESPASVAPTGCGWTTGCAAPSTRPTRWLGGGSGRCGGISTTARSSRRTPNS